MAARAGQWLVVLALAGASCGRATPSLTPPFASVSAPPAASPSGGPTPTPPQLAASGTPPSTPSPAPATPRATRTATQAPPLAISAANAISLTQLAAFGPGLVVSNSVSVTGSVRLDQVAWGPEAGQLAVAGALGVLIYDRATGVLTQPITTSAWATSLDFAPAGRALAAGTVNATVEVYDARDGELRAVLGGPGVQVEQVRYLPVPGSVLPAGYAVVSLGANNVLHFWDVALQAYLGQLDLGASPAHRFDLSPRAPAGRQWLAAAAGSTARVWAILKDGALSGLLAAPAFEAVPPDFELGQPAPLTTLALSADGHWLAAANTSGTILIWDLTNASAAPQTLARQAYPAEQLAFSPGGGLLASAHGDRLIRLWAVPGAAAGAEPLTTLAGATDRLTSLAFSPDGRELAAAGWEGVVRVWGIVD